MTVPSASDGVRAHGSGSPALLAAPLDSQARLVLVAWLCAWFALVAALMGLSVAGGGPVALTAGLVCGVAVPAAVLARLAGLPATYEIDGDELLVHRYLARTRAYRLRGPARRDPGAAGLHRRSVLLGGAYGCRTVTLPPGGGHVHLATTSLVEVLRVPTAQGPLLVTPADPEAFLRAVETALAS